MSTHNQSNDLLYRFVFEGTAVRGNHVHLQHTLTHAMQYQDCPAALRLALGQLMAASVMLCATLKLENGVMLLQIQGRGPLKLLVVECTSQLTLRATAKWDETISDDAYAAMGFAEMVGEGQFAIMLDPKNGGQTYQGIVPLEGDSIAQILENYMQRSEQIDTRLWLACDGEHASGLLLQRLPDSGEDIENIDSISGEAPDDVWQRIGLLANTVRQEEIAHLSAEVLLHRLFHEEQVRLFYAEAIAFHCGCSRIGVANMLRSLGQAEVDEILEEQKQVEVKCDFCHQAYAFDALDIAQLFTDDFSVPTNTIRH